MKSAFSHLEAAIRPDEILVMSRNKYVRGASIPPWTANEFPLSDEERAKKDSKKASNKALEEITILATGGGVVSESTPEVLSMARRYGMRVEEHAALIEICRYWQSSLPRIHVGSGVPCIPSMIPLSISRMLSLWLPIWSTATVTDAVSQTTRSCLKKASRV